ncbi:hypothetical protein [Candidatus Albibeggiatoa sp. nov. NOAA]|uniref:hypothetical protein n=1 Tax=Candidatus Albibeggiatoa sp. nov. NOAA TaxID=3162724 RepID=UPI0032FFAEF3|nr:type II toxin-antitoxin system VapB family antitoxin [Thiotrichaceae bacterium]
MSIQVTVDEDLLKQVMQVTNIQNSQILVEKALRFMLEPKETSKNMITEDKWQQFFNTSSVFEDDFLANRENDITQERDF